MDQIKYYRRVYTAFDFLADLGGLFGALTPFFTSVVFCVQYRSSYQFLMADIFVEKNINKEDRRKMLLAEEEKNRNESQ